MKRENWISYLINGEGGGLALCAFCGCVYFWGARVMCFFFLEGPVVDHKFVCFSIKYYSYNLAFLGEGEGGCLLYLLQQQGDEGVCY